MFKKAQEFAKKENKIPMVVYKKKGAHGEIIVLSFQDFLELIKKWVKTNREYSSQKNMV